MKATQDETMNCMNTVETAHREDGPLNHRICGICLRPANKRRKQHKGSR
jgi:hypothetical protein